MSVSRAAFCSACSERHNRIGQRHCLQCHAAFMRAWRVTHRLSGAAREKMNARSYANVYEQRGALRRQPCEVKGCRRRAEKHHDDYAKPLAVRWMCRTHHLGFHRGNAVTTPIDGFRKNLEASLGDLVAECEAKVAAAEENLAEQRGETESTPAVRLVP